MFDNKITTKRHKKRQFIIFNYKNMIFSKINFIILQSRKQK